MSHMVEQMMFVGEKPWHGLGNEVSEADAYDIPLCLSKAGAAWETLLKPLYIEEEKRIADPEGLDTVYRVNRHVDSRYCTVRSDSKMILGTVGPRYTPLQNVEAFDWFKPFLEDRQASLHTAGCLDEGRKVWVLARLSLDNATIVPGDEVSKFILLSNSHDGTLAVRVGFTPIRVVCMNTLRMAHSDDATKLIRIRHHKTVQKTLENIREVMNLANAEFEATAEQYRFLASKRVANVNDLEKYVKVVLKIEEPEDGKPLPTRTVNTIADIVKRFDNGIGSNIPGVRGTFWGAYNAVTEWLSYERGHNTDTRMHSLWFGDSANVNRLALDTALELADAA